MQTARLENRASGEIILLDEGDDARMLMRRIDENAHCFGEGLIRYAKGVRETLQWRELPALELSPTAPWKEGGVYLITGGAGGIGTDLRKGVAARLARATIVLAGRSPLTKDKAALLERWRALGGCRLCAGGCEPPRRGASLDRAHLRTAAASSMA